MTHAEIPEGTAQMTMRHFRETYSLAMKHAAETIRLELTHPDVLDSKPASDALRRLIERLEKLDGAIGETANAVR